MKAKIDSSVIKQTVRVLEERLRWTLPPYDESHISAMIGKRLKKTGLSSESYLRLLEADAGEAKSLVDSLLVTFSVFFRSPLAFAALEQEILPRLLKAKVKERVELRVWSAACAGGEEAWSTAILLHQLVAQHVRPPGYRILGTDVAEAGLNRARTGVYSVLELGNVRVSQLNTCFVKCGEAYSISPELRHGVDFTKYDLLDESTSSPPSSIYGHFDLIICANVLLYYRASARERILKKLQHCLAPGGYLMTSETEWRLIQNDVAFQPVNATTVIFQKHKDAF
jgi:chemotaxis protein methyltransferase CheR